MEFDLVINLTIAKAPERMTSHIESRRQGGEALGASESNIGDWV
jgi:hypothetical protein